MCFSALVKRDLKYLESRFGATPVRTDLYESYERKSRDDPNTYKPAAAQIFERKHWAPIIHFENEKRVIRLMRFAAWPPLNDRMKNRRTHNARRDNLTSPFWGAMLKKSRGLLVIESFREWVPVAGLLDDGLITLPEVEARFARKREELRAKAVAEGRIYRPSKVQAKDAKDRDIEIDFKPDPPFEMLVPVIFNWRQVDEEWQPAFAMMTDDPIPFVRDAGHDRSPILLSGDAMDAWLSPTERSTDEFYDLLGNVVRPPLTYNIAVDEAA